MSLVELLVIFAVAWSLVGFVVAVLLGRILRDVNMSPDEFTNRLIG